MPVIKHLSLMLYAKFDGSILTIFNIIVEKVWLFCGHGVVTAYISVLAEPISSNKSQQCYIPAISANV